MLNDLKTRIEDLRTELSKARGSERAEVLDHLEQATRQLEIHGTAVPAWAREALNAAYEAQAEDNFDNMPV